MSSQPLTGIEQVLAEASIRRLVHAYADAFLAKDAEQLVSLWADDLPEVTPPTFDAAWARGVPERWVHYGTTMLHVTTHWIEFDDSEHAHGRVQCIVQMDRPEGFVDQSVMYEDRYVRRGDQWLFAQRDHRLWFGRVRPEHPMDQEPTAWPKSQLGAGTLPDDVRRLSEASLRRQRVSDEGRDGQSVDEPRALARAPTPQSSGLLD
jgi:ketosteroid isomerase-like protein